LERRLRVRACVCGDVCCAGSAFYGSVNCAVLGSEILSRADGLHLGISGYGLPCLSLGCRWCCTASNASREKLAKSYQRLAWWGWGIFLDDQSPLFQQFTAQLLHLIFLSFLHLVSLNACYCAVSVGSLSDRSIFVLLHTTSLPKICPSSSLAFLGKGLSGREQCEFPSCHFLAG
jgi:hypothetical protein